MKVASSSGSEYPFAVWVEPSSVYGGAAEMEGGGRRIGFAVDMVEADGTV